MKSSRLYGPGHDEIVRNNFSRACSRKSLSCEASAGRRNALIPTARKRFLFYDTRTHVSLFSYDERIKKTCTADRNRLPVFHTQNVWNRRHANAVTAGRDGFTSKVDNVKRRMRLKISDFFQGRSQITVRFTVQFWFIDFHERIVKARFRFFRLLRLAAIGFFKRMSSSVKSINIF